MLLKHLLDSGLPQTAIADRLGVDRRTVHRWIAGGVTEQIAEAPRERVRPPTKLAPYEPIIRERLATYPELSAVRLLAECRAAGFRGGGAPPPPCLWTFQESEVEGREY